MKTLVIGPSWVGDMVMAQALFKCLRQAGAQIDVLAPAHSHPILARMPEVSASLAMPIGHGAVALRGRYALAKQLRQKKYQQAIILPNSFKSALIPFWAKIPIRTAWRGEMRYGLVNDMRILDKQQLPLMVQRFVALASPQQAVADVAKLTKDDIAPPSLKVDLTQAQKVAENLGLVCAGDILALCPGAEFGPAKQWPVAYYRELGQLALAKGWQVWIFGSEKDQAIAGEIAVGSDMKVLAGKTSLAQAVDLLALSSAVVSNDSGLMHVSAALQKPLVVLYGSTSAQFTPPLAKQVKIIQAELECSPCFKRECPYGHVNCLKSLPVARVEQGLAEFFPERWGA